jgi:hypothetical protein
MKIQDVIKPIFPGVEILAELSKIITGKLLTDAQIIAASKSIVGSQFLDFLAPTQKEVEAKERIENARRHISEASTIISSIQNELEDQATKLDFLVKEIEEKKELADRYATLAKANEESFRAYRAEMEDTVRKELIAQSEKHKNLRKVLAIFLFIFSAVFGGVVQFAMEPYVKPFIERRLKNEALPAPAPTQGSTPTMSPQR